MPEQKPSSSESARTAVLEKALERFLRELPRFIYIEPTNACNLHCTMCPTGRGDSPAPKGRMKFDLFRKIIQGARGMKQAEILFLHKDGEPLLNPDIVEMIEIAKESRISKEVSLASNATLLDEKLSREIIAAGLDELYVSIESLNPKRYAEIRVGAKLEQVVENIKRFIELKGGKGRGPRLVITTINMGCSAPDVMEIFEKWEHVADRVQVVERYGWAGRYNESLPRPRSRRIHPCAGLWYLMAVNWQGKVNLCCLDSGSTYPVADLNNETIADVWRGEAYRRFRALHLRGQFEEIPICRHCVDGDMAWMEKALSEI